VLDAAVRRDLLEAAVWAPSAENRHAFRYSFEGMQLRLHPDPAIAQASADQHYAMWLSIGAALENIVVAASVHGLRCEIARDRLSELADIRIDFVHRDAAPDELAACIGQRHTNRRLFYRGPRLSADERAALEAALAPLGGNWRLHWFDDDETRKPLCRLLREAEAHRYANAELHRAMFAGIRFDVGWRRSAEEGLPPAALGIEPGMRGAFSLLRHWPLARALARAGLHHAIAARASAFPARRAPHLCVLASRTALESVDALLRAGRAMERLWLAATRRGLAAQPFAAAVALARAGRSALDDAARARLVRAWRELVPDAHPVMVFRFGYAAPPAVRAGRPRASVLVYRHQI